MDLLTLRFDHLKIEDGDILTFPAGLIGLPKLTKFCLVDPGDDNLILWLQSIEDPKMCFPVLEPKIFKPDYVVRLSGMELRELKLEQVTQSAVFSILTIPADPKEMSANLKAPVVINLREKIARQVVLQENEYSIKHPMFSELRTHLVTLSSQKQRLSDMLSNPAPVHLAHIPPSLTVRPPQGH